MLFLIIISIIGSGILWAMLLCEEDVYDDPNRFFGTNKKRKIGCLLLGPGAWTVEGIKRLVIELRDLFLPLFQWFKSKDE